MTKWQVSMGWGMGVPPPWGLPPYPLTQPAPSVAGKHGSRFAIHLFKKFSRKNFANFHEPLSKKFSGKKFSPKKLFILSKCRIFATQKNY